MTKTITIRIEYPTLISADDSDGQFMTIIRDPLAADETPSDADSCVVKSGRPGEDEVTGNITWGKAFAAIQDFMNCTQLDNGWNT